MPLERKPSAIWHSDIPGMFVLILQPVLAVLFVLFFVSIVHLEYRLAIAVFACAVFSATVGAVLLFLARLPLYRQRVFFTFGSRLLDARHKRLYRMAYGFIGIALLLLLVVLLVR